MKIDIIHQKFHERLTAISAYQQAGRRLANSELAKLHSHRDIYQKNPIEENKFFSNQNMFYHNPINGETQLYGKQRLKIEDAIQAVELHQNKQYQWLLVEAYEEYEEFLRLAYASAGFYDHNFWPLSDFGNITLKEIESKNWEWYVQQSRKKKGFPEACLSRFREQLSEFKMLEINNRLGVDLKLSISFISVARHHIVHAAGKVSDKKNFIKNILEKIGRYQNGKPLPEDLEFIESYFYLKAPHSETISLLELVNKDHSPGFFSYTNVFDELFSFLLANAHCLFFALEKHQSSSN